MLTVSDLMTIAPMTISPTTPLVEAIEIMQLENCRHLPVMDGNILVGILTDRDIRSARHTAVFDTALTESCMTRDLITITPDTLANKAAELLILYRVDALPVIDQNKLVGIITVSDFLNRFQSNYNDDDLIDSDYASALSASNWGLVNG